MNRYGEDYDGPVYKEILPEDVKDFQVQAAGFIEGAEDMSLENIVQALGEKYPDDFNKDLSDSMKAEDSKDSEKLRAFQTNLQKKVDAQKLRSEIKHILDHYEPEQK